MTSSRPERWINYSKGAPTNEGETLEYSRHHPKAVLNWYKSDFLGGSHEIRSGVEYMPNRGYRGNYIPLSGQNYRLVFNNGAPIEIEAWNYPTFPNQHVDYFGAYGQDAWTIGRRLTLNLGLRYGHDNTYIPGSCREPAVAPSNNVFPAACYDEVQFNVLNMVSPRTRFAYDLTGNGLTVLKGGWGRYNQIHMIDPDVEGTDPNQKSTASFRWLDPKFLQRSYASFIYGRDFGHIPFRCMSTHQSAIGRLRLLSKFDPTLTPIQDLQPALFFL